MSRINISENQEAWGKKSWINNFVNDKAVIANLTEEYAHDILESVNEDFFPSLDSAIADLSLRTGLTASEASEIKRVCVAMVTKKSEETIEAGSACEMKKNIPGLKEEDEKSGEGAGLTKESPKEASAKMTLKDKIAKGMNPGFQAYLDKKKEEREGKKSTEETDNKEEKEASVSSDKTAWFQGNDAPSSKESGGTNDPSKMGYPGELKYEHKPMETTAPGGQDTRPYEQTAFESSAKETKKVMGPQGKELATKIEMQRLEKGDKAANARMIALRQIVASGKK